MLGFGLLLASVAAASAATPPLRPYTATYDVYRNGAAAGRSVVTLRQDGNRWSLDSSTRGTHGLAALAAVNINEHSDFRVHDGRVETLGYRYEQKALMKSKQRSIDVEDDRIVSSDKHGRHEFPMQAGVLDHQSLSAAMAQDLASGKRGTLTYTVVDRDQMGEQRYQVGKQATSNVPAGAIPTIAVVRLRDAGNSRVTTSWLGIDNGFVPVRVVQAEPNGEVYEMKLVSLKR